MVAFWGGVVEPVEKDRLRKEVKKRMSRLAEGDQKTGWERIVGKLKGLRKRTNAKLLHI